MKMVRSFLPVGQGAFYCEQFKIMNQVMQKLLEKFSKEQMDDLMSSLKNLEIAISEIVELNI